MKFEEFFYVSKTSWKFLCNTIWLISNSTCTYQLQVEFMVFNHFILTLKFPPWQVPKVNKSESFLPGDLLPCRIPAWIPAVMVAQGTRAGKSWVPSAGLSARGSDARPVKERVRTIIVSWRSRSVSRCRRARERVCQVPLISATKSALDVVTL